MIVKLTDYDTALPVLVNIEHLQYARVASNPPKGERTILYIHNLTFKEVREKPDDIYKKIVEQLHS